MLRNKFSSLCARVTISLRSAPAPTARLCLLQRNHRCVPNGPDLQKFLIHTSEGTRDSSSSSQATDKEQTEGFDEDTGNRGKSEEDIRIEILENALNYVPTHGWTRESLSLGAEEAGYPSVAEGMFSRGEADLVLYLVKSNNANLLKYMDGITNNQDGQKLRTSEFIRNVLEHRLRMIIPYIDVWSDAMAILMQPTVVVEATQELGKMADDIWFYAGDTSTDFNWYTKRGLLAKLFVSVQTVMVKDQSPDFVDSWQFLDRRMKDIATFGKITNSLRKTGQMASDVTFAGFTVLRNVTGMGERRR